MVYKKMKAIREFLELTTTQVASLIKVNSYLYRKYEDGSIAVPVDYLVLLSKAYCLQMSSWIPNEKNLSDCICNDSIQYLKSLSIEMRISRIEKNICACVPLESQKVTTRVLSKILSDYRQSLAEKLLFLRNKEGIDIETISKSINISGDYYLAFENGRLIPNLEVFYSLAILYKIDICDLL